MASKLNFVVEKENVGLRLDKFLLLNNSEFTRSHIQKLIENGCVLVNGIAISKNYKCKKNDCIELNIPDEKIEILPENIPLNIVYEDDDLLVVNKSKGMVVHPANGNWSGTLVNALMYHCNDSLSTINGEIRPGIVHRIDKDTSGLLIVAKNDDSHIKLAQQIKEHSFSRAYEAIVYGNVKNDTSIICKPIGRNPKDRKKMAVTMNNSKQAVTKYEVIERYKGFTHIRCILETGRTHQIRVHMASIGHPVAGDSVYGPKKVIKELNGQCLHAKHIGFIHPTTNEYIEFESELPEYFTDFLKKLKPMN